MDKRNCILLSAWDKGVGGSCLDSLLLRKRLRAASVTGQEALLGCLYTPGLAFFCLFLDRVTTDHDYCFGLDLQPRMALSGFFVIATDTQHCSSFS